MRKEIGSRTKTILLFSVVRLLFEQLDAIFDSSSITGPPFIIRSDGIDGYIKLLNLY